MQTQCRGLKSTFKVLSVLCIKCGKTIFLERAWSYTKSDCKTSYVCITCAPDRKTALLTILRAVFPNAFRKILFSDSEDKVKEPVLATSQPALKELKQITNDMLIRAGVLSPITTESNEDSTTLKEDS